MTDVLGYIRVSTEEQAEDGVSLEIQEGKIRAYCSLYGLNLVGIVTDAGVSAKTLKRPGLTSALARLASGEVQGLVIAKLDRLSRSVKDFADLIDRFFCEKAGSFLFSVNDQIDTRTPSGLLVLNVLMSVAQWERQEIGVRTKTAMQHLKSKNYSTGVVLYGRMLDTSSVDAEGEPTGLTIPCPVEQEAIALMLALRSRGFSFNAVAAELNDRGIPTKANKTWHATTVINVLKRAAA